ncbi:MAG TPA: bifunctional 5,10-methylenetetrahydrofolate dehydrogenase/5,10-methenyltetrahydrofolate cyclohydrolase [Actinomycetota bacterium]|nr:bifunctional 5,10-methylenetetrahydrofolate dehydrogenase/5,10-methenyltetrahydrofolate cyclohydrolase [Actinomycetota bacterium]
MADIIDGRKIAEEVFDELRGRIAALGDKDVVPGLAVILVGDDPASATYVRLKGRDARKLGIAEVTHKLPPATEADDLEELIDSLNADSSIHGILLQTPIPPHLDELTFLSRIAPVKDIDGLHPTNQGLLMRGQPRFISCTPYGVQQLLVRTGVPIAGQHVVVVGRSVLVGRPLSVLLSNKADDANATVTICHTGTRDLARYTSRADIVVAAAGSPGMITAEHVSEGAVLIDVGTTPNAEGKLVGDVDFASVSQKVRAITPVPGGVGPMTRAMLMWNTVLAAERTVS